MRSTSGLLEHKPGHQTTALVVLLTGSFLSQAAVAGPVVGNRVGVPSSTTTTVQARVVSSTPVVAQVSVPQEVCYDELQSREVQSSGAGALLGAVAGAAVGNAVGKGSGRALATGVGLIGGAILGNHIENRGRPTETHTVRKCEQETRYENQVVAYNVIYEINGQRYNTQMPNDPGNTIAVQMTVSPVTYSHTSQTYQGSPVVVAPVVQPVRYVSMPMVRHGRHHQRHAEGAAVYPVVYAYPVTRHGDHRWR